MNTDTDEAGGYRFDTIKPGPVSIGNGHTPQAPHMLVRVYAPGILTRWVTQMYFDGHAANDTDPVLRLVPPARRGTLLARRDEHGYRFDTRLQGEQDTVFFDV